MPEGIKSYPMITQILFRGCHQIYHTNDIMKLIIHRCICSKDGLINEINTYRLPEHLRYFFNFLMMVSCFGHQFCLLHKINYLSKMSPTLFLNEHELSIQKNYIKNVLSVNSSKVDIMKSICKKHFIFSILIKLITLCI